MKRLIDTNDIDYLKSLQDLIDASGIIKDNIDLNGNDIYNVSAINDNEDFTWKIDSDGWLSIAGDGLTLTSSAGEDYEMTLRFDEDTEAESSTEFRLKPDGIYLDGEKIGQFENIVDSAGNKRFVEGAGTPKTVEGVTYTYCRWSLSGTHLMLVIAGNIADTTELGQYTFGANFVLPEWIYNKIYPVWASSQIEIKSINLRASNWSTQSINMALSKSTSNTLIIQNSQAALTLTADRSFRVQFDLLIDADYSE